MALSLWLSDSDFQYFHSPERLLLWNSCCLKIVTAKAYVVDLFDNTDMVYEISDHIDHFDFAHL